MERGDCGESSDCGGGWVTGERGVQRGGYGEGRCRVGRRRVCVVEMENSVTDEGPIKMTGTESCVFNMEPLSSFNCSGAIGESGCARRPSLSGRQAEHGPIHQLNQAAELFTMRSIEQQHNLSINTCRKALTIHCNCRLNSS